METPKQRYMKSEKGRQTTEAYMHKYYLEHKEIFKVSHKEYYERNRDMILEKARLRYLAKKAISAPSQEHATLESH